VRFLLTKNKTLCRRRRRRRGEREHHLLRKLETKIWDQIRGKERNYIVYLLSELLIVQRGIQPGLTETENHNIEEEEEGN
jgi:hypothetical protein